MRLLILFMFLTNLLSGQFIITAPQEACKESTIELVVVENPAFTDVWNIASLYRWHDNTSYTMSNNMFVPTPTLVSNHDTLEVLALLSYRTVLGVDSLVYSNVLKIPVKDCTSSLFEPQSTKRIKVIYDYLGRVLNEPKGFCVIIFEDNTSTKRYY